MDGFSQKLRLIYTKLFHEDIEKFTEAFIDNNKFKKSEQSTKEFFLNRKTVLRRWLSKEIGCTNDFQKSFKNYKISSYQLRGEALFSLDDFKEANNLEAFEEKIDLYLQYKQEVYVNKEYKYIYIFCMEKEEILLYNIIKWEKGEGDDVVITLEQDSTLYKGTLSLREDNNIFMSMKIERTTLYLLFHDTHDSSAKYIVGTSMGYHTQDNKVPTSQKVLFAKEKLDIKEIELSFILNETESIAAIENRLNLNSEELKINHFVKYANKFKKYHTLFNRLIRKKYHQYFYHRLAFREFYAFFRLFEHFSKKETYYIFDYQRAFFEAIKTVESIQNIPFYMVMELNEENLFFARSDKEIKIKERFLKLSTHGVEVTVIFIVDEFSSLSIPCKELLDEMQEHNVEVKVVEKEKIVHKVNSLDFFFIHLGDERDFVLADPIRDNKDVFKLFINEVTLDEYRSDYRMIDKKSKVFFKDKV